MSCGMGVDIEKERKRILEAKEALRKTSSPYMRRDLKKFIAREERSIRQAERYLQAAGKKALSAEVGTD